MTQHKPFKITDLDQLPISSYFTPFRPYWDYLVPIKLTYQSLILIYHLLINVVPVYFINTYFLKSSYTISCFPVSITCQYNFLHYTNQSQMVVSQGQEKQNLHACMQKCNIYQEYFTHNNIAYICSYKNQLNASDIHQLMVSLRSSLNL